MVKSGGAQVVEERLGRDRRLVDLWLRRALREEQGVPPGLGAAMRYALLGPGKRLRPILGLWAFRACRGGRDERVRPFCCGLEMIHAFSLVHDDLPSMDDDDMRRGRPSLHRRFDEATADMSGDGLLARGFGLIAECGVPAGRVCRVVRMVAGAIGPAGMAGGQFEDVRGGFRGTGGGVRRVARMEQRKTGELFAVSLAGAGVLAGAGEGVVEGLYQAGLALGAVFQLTDDLLDERSGRGERASGMVACAGRERTERRAVVMARRAERLFAGLGAGFGLLAGLPAQVLRRIE